MDRKIYTGIGSRRTPPEILTVMEALARRLAQDGWTLRSGGAEGADQAFERGVADVGGPSEIYRPAHSTSASERIAAEYHPVWKNMSRGAQQLHGRNTLQVLGQDLNTSSRFVVCWTPDGAIRHTERSATTGGTGTAISIASERRIPVFNLARPDHLARVQAYIESGLVRLQDLPEVNLSARAQLDRTHPDWIQGKEQADLDAADRVVASYWHDRHTERLRGIIGSDEVVLISQPSTSRANTIPISLADRLVQKLGTEHLAGNDYFVVRHTKASKHIPRSERLFERRDYAVKDRAAFQAAVAGRRVVIVEDLLTTGGSAAEFARQIAREGAEVAAVTALTGDPRLRIDQKTADKLAAVLKEKKIEINPRELMRELTRTETGQLIMKANTVRSEDGRKKLTEKLQRILNRAAAKNLGRTERTDRDKGFPGRDPGHGRVSARVRPWDLRPAQDRPKSIARHRTAEINEIFSQALACRCYSSENGLTGQAVDPNVVRHQFEFHRFSKVQEIGPGQYSLNVHNDLWYRIETGGKEYGKREVERNPAQAPRQASIFDFFEESQDHQREEQVLSPTVRVWAQNRGYIEGSRTVRGPGDIAGIVAPSIRNDAQENIVVVHVRKNQILDVHHYSRGTGSSSQLNLIEIAGRAMNHGADQIYFIHNHPSGQPSPSADDRAVITSLDDICSLGGIKTTGVLIAGNKYVTFDDKVTSIATSVPIITDKSKLPVFSRGLERLSSGKKVSGPIDAEVVWGQQFQRKSGVMFASPTNEIIGFQTWPRNTDSKVVAALIVQRAEALNATMAIVADNSDLSHNPAKTKFIGDLRAALFGSLEIADVMDQRGSAFFRQTFEAEFGKKPQTQIESQAAFKAACESLRQSYSIAPAIQAGRATTAEVSKPAVAQVVQAQQSVKVIKRGGFSR